MIRERFSRDLKAAIKSDDPVRAATLRLICAAIKDQELHLRNDDGAGELSDDKIMGFLLKMVEQRERSAAAYEEAGQLDLADEERKEIEIIRTYLPKQLSECEVEQAIDKAIERTGASSIRDINRVMANLKANHSGQMDFGRACASLKNAFR
ncbi:GatB/YqeY domain-containing protein [Amaricoccus tamworthensis]|uniref:GatB/YqeY domain-containing protein n=1 Tax=Amaricoccus tamworthensis TaxID=57002 RepID=UPI003C79EC30